MSVDEHKVALSSATIFYRAAPVPERRGDRPAATPVFIHGAPMSSDVWLPVLARTGGIAPDLPGFGRSDKGGHLDYTPAGLAAAVAELIEHLELTDVTLVGQQWGAVVARHLAAAPFVGRLVLISPGAGTWPRLERLWRTPAVGELVMGSITKRVLARMLHTDDVTALWEQFDQGTQRATLRLYRSSMETPGTDRPTTVLHEIDPDAIAAAL